MANVIKEQKLIDTQKRALLKYIFIGDGTTAQSNTVLVDVSNLAYSLNANGQIMVSNTHQKSVYRTTIKRVFGQAKANGYAVLQWHGMNGLSNQEIVTISSGGFDYEFENLGGGAVMHNPNLSDSANTNGDIMISTVSPGVDDVFTIFVDLKKDNQDYDAGQTADPKSFNIV